MNAKHSSESKEHYTPSDYIESARYVMGSIQLDVASCAMANTIVKANRFFTQDKDALSANCTWEANTAWCNPPGGKIKNKSQAAIFGERLVIHHYCRHIQQAFFVGFTMEIMQTCQALLAYPHCIPRKRIKYLKNWYGNLVVGESPTHASVIFYLPPMPEPGVNCFSEKDIARFHAEFSKYGTVLMGTEQVFI